MIDRITFMETLRSVADIAKATHHPLSKDEILFYFKDMDLSEEQQELVYQYLLAPQSEKDVDTSNEVDDENSFPANDTNDITEELDISIDSNQRSLYEPTNPKNKDLRESFFKMYLKDINQLPNYTKKEKNDFYINLLNGDKRAIQTISDFWLKKVLELATDYINRDIHMEDVIQEGNISLLCALNNLLGAKQFDHIEEYLMNSIKESMEAYIDASTIADDWESTILAKATLIHEAKKALAENLGRIPTEDELCIYTNMSSEEINNILELSTDIR